MKQFEIQMKMIDLVLQTRKISEEDKENLAINELLQKNQELNKEDFEFNENQTSDIDLVKMLENNFNEKKKIFEAKK